MKHFYIPFVQWSLIARVCLLGAIVFASFNTYSQSENSLPYGMTVEQWRQNHKPVKYNLINKSYNTLGNIFNNGGFETGDLSGWITQDVTNPFYPLQVGTNGIDVSYGLFISDPVEGKYAVLHGWDGDPGTISLAQDITLPSNAQTLEFDYRAGWNLDLGGATQDRNFIINIEPSGGGIPLKSDTVLTAVAPTINDDTGDLHGSIDLSAYANSSVRISFYWTVPESRTGPAFFQLDNVFIRYTGPQIIVTKNIDFWHIEAGTSSSPRTITISSVGTDTCTVSGISNPGSPFSLNKE